MRISPQEARRELVLLRHEVRSLRVNPRRLSLCPLPAGEGVSEFQRQGWVRAKSITPHPKRVLLRILALPSPARGEGANASAEFFDTAELA
jgi:hypothetical protein